MTPRSIRRAAERGSLEQAAKALKSANQAQPFDDKADTLSLEPESLTQQPSVRPASDAKLAANRANAEKSTGPRTPKGKARTRFNAVRHNLTGRTILLPADDAALYENHCQAFNHDLKPTGIREELLVQNIADHQWRLARIPALEAGIYALGRQRFGRYANPKVIADSSEVETYLAYEKQLRNLHLQESRLTRYVRNDMTELKALQQARAEEEKQQFAAAAALAAEATAHGQAFHPQEFGFVFSATDLQAFTDSKGDLALAKKLSQVRARRLRTGPQTGAQAA